MHVWLLCPFINAEAARAEWRRAVERAGMDLGAVDSIVLDIKEVRVRPEEIGHELIKGADAVRFSRLNVGGEDVFEYAANWCLAEEMEGGRVPVTVLAEVYEALEGVRLNQGSRGFLASHTPTCPCCGVIGARMSVKRVAGNGDGTP